MEAQINLLFVFSALNRNRIGRWMDGLCYEPHAEGCAYATDGIKSWSTIGAQGFV
jgi:hypothetical protein